MSLVYLIRHGQASFGRSNYDRLSDTGVRQAEVMGQYFRRLGWSFDAAVSGVMARQTLTAETALAALPQAPRLEIDEAFNEYDTFSIMNHHLPRLVEEQPDLAPLVDQIESDERVFWSLYQKAMLRWQSGAEAPGEHETWKGFGDRTIAGLQRATEGLGSDAKVAVFTSGGCISTLLQRALNLDNERTLRLAWQIKNASISLLKYNPKGLQLVSFNSVAHLEENGNPEIITMR